jgi:hypothetical protein
LLRLHERIIHDSLFLSLEGQQAFEFIGLLKVELPHDSVVDELSEQYWNSLSPSQSARIVLDMPADTPFSFFVVVSEILAELDEAVLGRAVLNWAHNIGTQRQDWRKQQKHVTEGRYPGWVEEIDASGQLQLGDV